MERVKANHLTRQLQMRLQYARLKVENGWQKQNLNEVENLYFHNSHLRGSKQPSAPAVIVTTQLPPQGSSLISSAMASQLLSIVNNNTSEAPAPTLTTEAEGLDQDLFNRVLEVVAAAAAAASGPSTTTAAESSSMQVDTLPSEVPPPPPLLVVPPGIQDSSTSTTNSAAAATATAPSNTGLLVFPHSPSSPSSSSSSSLNHYPSTKPPRTRNNKHPAGPKGAHQNLTPKDMLDFASTSSLTYDSFWSSHSTSSSSMMMMLPSSSASSASWLPPPPPPSQAPPTSSSPSPLKPLQAHATTTTTTSAAAAITYPKSGLFTTTTDLSPFANPAAFTTANVEQSRGVAQ